MTDDVVGNEPQDEEPAATTPEDALARAAALGPLPGIHDEADAGSEPGESELTPGEEKDDVVGFNLRG